MVSMSYVSFVKNKERREGFIQSINKSLDLIDYSFKKDVNRVVIKPNLCYYWDYSTGQTTDPYFTGALINVLRSKYLVILISLL